MQVDLRCYVLMIPARSTNPPQVKLVLGAKQDKEKKKKKRLS